MSYKQITKKRRTRRENKKTLYKSAADYYEKNPRSATAPRPKLSFMESLFIPSTQEKMTTILNRSAPQPGTMDKKTARNLYRSLPHTVIRKSLKNKKGMLRFKKPLSFFFPESFKTEKDNLQAAEIISYLPTDINNKILEYMQPEQQFHFYFGEEPTNFADKNNRLNQIYDLCKLYLLEFENKPNLRSINRILSSFSSFFENIKPVGVFSVLALYINNRLRTDPEFVLANYIHDPANYYNHDIINFLRFFRYLSCEKNANGEPLDTSIPIPIVKEFWWEGEVVLDEEDENEIINVPDRLTLKKTVPLNRILNILLLVDWKSYEIQCNGINLWTFWCIHWYSERFGSHSFDYYYKYSNAKLLSIIKSFNGTNPDEESTDDTYVENEMSIVLDMDDIPQADTENGSIEVPFLLDSTIPTDKNIFQDKMDITVRYAGLLGWKVRINDLPQDAVHARAALTQARARYPTIYELYDQLLL